MPGGAGPCSLWGNWLFHEGRLSLGNQPPLLSVTLAAVRCWGGKINPSSGMALAFIPHPAHQLLLRAQPGAPGKAQGSDESGAPLPLQGCLLRNTKLGDPVLAILSNHPSFSRLPWQPGFPLCSHLVVVAASDAVGSWGWLGCCWDVGFVG